VRVLRSLVLGLAFVGLFFGGGLRGVTPARAGEIGVHLESAQLDKLPELKTFVTLVDEKYRPQRAKAGFKLLIDNVEQKDTTVTVTPVSEEKTPVACFVVVQTSAVMEPVLKSVRSGIEKLAKGLAKNPDNKLGIIMYSDEPKKLEDLGRPNEVARELDRLVANPDAAEVHMVDAARLAIDLLREQKDSRKLLILFSDGIDAMQSKDAYDSVGKRAREHGIVVDTIGYQPFEKGRLRTLIDIAKLAGSTARGANTGGEIVERFNQVLDEVQAGHIVRFFLTQPGDGNTHQLQIVYREGKDDYTSEPLSVTLPVFEPAEPAGRPWWHWLFIIGGGLLGLIVLLGIIGTIMGRKQG
jgi:hypothetical protein